MKKNIDELKEMLLGKEMQFMLLDAIMWNNGYYSVLNYGLTKYIKEKLKVVYSVFSTGIPEIVIKFKITHDTGPDEIEETFYLKVLDIQEY